MWAILLRERLRHFHRNWRNGDPIDVGWKTIIAVLFGWFLFGACIGLLVASLLSFYTRDKEIWVCREDPSQQLPEDGKCIRKILGPTKMMMFMNPRP